MTLVTRDRFRRRTSICKRNAWIRLTVDYRAGNSVASVRLPWTRFYNAQRMNINEAQQNLRHRCQAVQGRPPPFPLQRVLGSFKGICFTRCRRRLVANHQSVLGFARAQINMSSTNSGPATPGLSKMGNTLRCCAVFLKSRCSPSPTRLHCILMNYRDNQNRYEQIYGNSKFS